MEREPLCGNTDRLPLMRRRFRISIRPEVLPFLGITLLFCAIIFTLSCRFTRLGTGESLAGTSIIFLVIGGYFLWFFRDPERATPPDPKLIVAAAEGEVARITVMNAESFRSIAVFAGLSLDDLSPFFKGNTIRISIFLSLFDVHVNRMPIDGKSRFLGYFPGKHLFTFDEKSSDVNQHNSIYVENAKTVCLINQIVGPVCRRVVYWLDKDNPVDVKKGQEFGMMKFGSRLDMYFPADDIEITVREGMRVRSGETEIARYKR